MYINGIVGPGSILGGWVKAAFSLNSLGIDSDAIKDEFDYIIDGIKKNSLTRGELGRSAAIGALSTALAAAGIGAITGRKGKRLKRALIAGAIGAAAGGVAAPMYSQIRKYLDGIPFDNSDFMSRVRKAGDKVYIGVAGSANGEGESWFADEMRKRFPGSAYMLRHVDRDRLNEIYNHLKSMGLDVTVVGHSSGGPTAAKFLTDHPEAKGYLIDPVSWLGRNVPDNAVVFTSDKSTRHGGPFENVIADVGGRWNNEGKNSIVFKGSHSDRMGDLIGDIISKGVRPGQIVNNIPRYITGVFGNTIK